MTAPITIDQLPGPHGVPFIGNLLELNTPNPMEKLIEWGREYGPIFRLQVPGNDRVVVSGAELVAEICDDTRFGKQLGAGLKVGQDGHTSQGLFTSETADPMWRRAHNILMAPFSQQAMRGYLPRMVDIAGQLVDKWSRLNPDDEVNIPQDMTALTLDTIALCGFDYRFNSLYRDTPHPFVAAMVRSLAERQKQAKELPIQRKLRIQARRQYKEDQEFQVNLVKGLMADRRRLGDKADNSDLFGLMLTGVDKQSGLILPDDNIIAQCLTFLIAGHETTSGLLVVRDLLLDEEPAVRAAGPGRGGRGARRRHRTQLRADPPAQLCPTDSRRVAADVADRANVHQNATAGHRDRRQVCICQGHRTVDSGADAAPGP